MSERNSMAVPPYGTAIQQAIASGDLVKMREIAAHTEKWLEGQKGLETALHALRDEIARLEKRSS